MTTILQTIAAHAQERVAIARAMVPTEVLRARAEAMVCGTGFPFERAIAEAADLGFICECKKASPSRGVIAETYDPVEIARAYEEAGATCISVLTEPRWFLGEDRHLAEVSAAVSIPCLRKDFTVDPYMVYEAKLLGASAVLLICALLSTGELRDYLALCDHLGLSALVEAHDETEIESALQAGARIVGVNHRNLRDFSVDTGHSARLRALVPPGVLYVAESGIRTPAEVDALRNLPVDAVLVGETLMRAPDKKAALETLRGDRQ